MKPIIGLTMHNVKKAMQVNDAYIQSIIQAGGIQGVAEELVVSAESSDGIVEALEHPFKKYCLFVQWHPEELAICNDKFALKLFKSLMMLVSTKLGMVL